MNLKTSLFSAAILATLSGLTSCNTWTANERRIDKNPSLFLALTDSERDLVMQGKIREGMSHDAVFLAWGKPDAVRSGSANGRAHETWAYFRSVPTHRNNFSYSYGGGFHNHFGVHPSYGYCSGPGWTFGTEIDYVSELTKSVTFRNDRVVEWEAQH